MIHVFYYQMTKRLPAASFNHYLQQVPPFIQKKIEAFRQWQDAERSLIGNILLIKGLKSLHYAGYSLAQLKFTEYNKPYFDDKINFNITHSGQYIVCAISDCCKVGIDVEEVNKIPLVDFTEFFYDEEWQAVLNSPDQLHAFYTLWTKKEAFLKVIGSGLNVPLNQVVISDNSIAWRNQLWHLKEVLLGSNHISWLCTDQKFAEVKISRAEL
jgi:4'-phosphopantetheinyl transferase